MIAKHRDHALAQAYRPAQHIHRIRAAIDQIAYQPQAVLRRVELDFLQQLIQCFEATLNIADGVSGHKCSIDLNRAILPAARAAAHDRITACHSNNFALLPTRLLMD